MTQNIEIPWQVTFPEKDAVTRYVRPSLVAACHGNERMAEVLDYIIHTGSWEAKNQGLPKGCNVVKIHRTHKEILSHLKVKPSRKTLIHYFDLFNEWGYVLSERYQRDLLVHFDTIQKNINTPPASDQKPGCHHRLYAKGCSSSTLQHSENEDDETAKKVVALQQKVVTLQQKVEELQQKVVSQETLQRDFEALQKRVEDLFFSPTTYYCLLPSFTNEDTLGDGSLNANVTPPLVSAGTETDTHSHDDTSNLPALFESLATAGGHIATDDVPTTEEQDAREQAETLRALVEAGVVQVTSPVSEPAVESVKLTEDAPSMSGECPVSDPPAVEEMPREASERQKPSKRAAKAEQAEKKPRAAKQPPLTEPTDEELVIIHDWQAIFKKPIPISPGLVKAARMLVPCHPTGEQLAEVRKYCYASNPGWFGANGRKRGNVTLLDVAEYWSGWLASQGDSEMDDTASGAPSGDNDGDEFYPAPDKKLILWKEKAAALATASR